MRIKRGDSVVVIAGDQKGPTPHRVIQVLNGGQRLLVEGINRVFKHVRRGHPRSPQGGRLQLEVPIDASNVKLYCGSCNQATRVGYRYTNDGAKERYCKTCSASVGAVSPARKQYASR